MQNLRKEPTCRNWSLFSNIGGSGKEHIISRIPFLFELFETLTALLIKSTDSQCGLLYQQADNPEFQSKMRQTTASTGGKS